MNEIEFFKLQAKNLKRDFDSQYQESVSNYAYKPRFFKDIDWIIVEFDINEEKFTLMNAQHIVALLAGFNNWSELIYSDNYGLELGMLLFQYRNEYVNGYLLWDHWNNYLMFNKFSNKSNSFKLELFKNLYPNMIK